MLVLTCATFFKCDNPTLVDVFSPTGRNVSVVYITLTWKQVILTIVYVYHRKCLRRSILSTRSHIGVWNFFLTLLFRMMLVLSPFMCLIYLMILMTSIGCTINYLCQYWTNMPLLKLKLWTHSFHIWTLHCKKPLIKEKYGVAIISETATINTSEWNMLCGGIVWQSCIRTPLEIFHSPL